MGGSRLFANTGLLSRFIIRRERFKIVFWLLGIILFTIMVPIAFSALYSTQQERDLMAETMKNPAMTAMVGHGDLTNYTVGAMTAHQMLLITSIIAAIMNILMASRHTRGEEEDGRVEMIRSLPVGRLSSLNAVGLVLCVINLLLALLTAAGLYALNIESMDMEGSLLYGLVLGGAGLFFAAATTVFAQLSESSRSAMGLSIVVMIAAYLLRAIGDATNEALSWISPFGWVTAAEVYSNNSWSPLLLLIGAAAILFVIANYLNVRRDLGAGMLSAKPGRKHASFYLQNPIGLAWRLQRTGVIAWAIGMFVLGLSYGSVFGDLEGFFEGNDMLEQMLLSQPGFTLTEQFLSVLMVVLALIASISPLMSMNKLYGEEKRNRLEHLLGRAVSRTRLMGSYLVLSVINGFMMISFTAIGLWAAEIAVMEDPISFSVIYGAALAYYPAMLIMISISLFLIGTMPRLSGFIWLYVVYSFIALYLGGLFQFHEWVGKFSPYGYVPQMPIEDMSLIKMLVLSVVALLITIVGFIAYNKRDIHG